MGKIWDDFKRTGREMYGIPEGTTAARFVASLPGDYVRHTRTEAVSRAYSKRRTAGLQAIMNYQHMGGDTREAIAAREGGELPYGYYETREAAHNALEDFPELRQWIDLDAIR